MQAVLVGHLEIQGEDVTVTDTDSENRDDWLIRQIAEGNRRAFEELFESYGKRVFRYAVRMIGDVTKAEEVTNDVMLEVWKSAAKFEGLSLIHI